MLQGLQGSIYFHDVVNDENLFTSEKILERTGYTKEEILEMENGFRSIIHPDDMEGVFQMNKRVAELKDGDFAEATYRTRKKNGDWVWYRSEEYVYKRDADGRPTVIIGVAHNVNQLKEKEDELQKLADHNAFLVEISQLITGGQGDMKSTLQALSKRLAEQFQVVCSIFFHDETDNSIQPGAVFYHDKELVETLTDLFTKTTVKVGEGMVGKVIRDGKEFVISETDKGLRERTAAVHPRLEAVGLAYLPIKGLSKIVGAINLVQLIEFKPFTKLEWETIAQVVRNVSLFVEHSIITNERKDELERLAAAEAELIERNSTSTFQLEMSMLLSDFQTDKYSILAKVAKWMAEHFNAGCDIYLLNEEDLIEPVAWYHPKPKVRKKLKELLKEKKWMKKGQGNIGKLIEDRGEFIMYPDNPALEELNQKIDSAIQSSSFIYISAVGHDRSLGAIGLTRLKKDAPFNDRQHDEIRKVVKNISLFLNSRLQFEERQDELKKRQVVEKELLALNRSNAFQLELSKVLSDLSSNKKKTLYALAKMISVQFDAVTDIHLIEDDETLEPVAWYHQKKGIRDKVGKMFDLGRFKIGQGILGGVAKNAKEFVKLEIPAEFYESRSKMDQELRACSFMYLPIVGYDKVIGTFGLTRLVGQSSFTDTELEQVRQAVTTLSQFLDNRLLFEARYEELNKRTEAEAHLTELDDFNKFLLGVSQRLSDLGSDMTDVLQGLAQSITQQFDITCCIHLVDAEQGIFKPLAVSHKDPEKAERILSFFTSMRFKWDYGIVGEVLKSGEILRIKKVGKKDRSRFDAEDDSLIPGSLLYLPIKDREGTIGIFDLTREKGANYISDLEVEQLREVASNISLFVNNHLVFDQKQAELEKRKLAEEALIAQNTQIEQAEQEMRGILDTMPILVARVDREKRFRFANKAYSNLLGFEQNWMVGKHLSEVIGKEQFKGIEAYYERVLNGESLKYSNHALMPDGSNRFFDVVNAPDRGPNGEIIGVLSCVVDVTDQAVAEKELESSEEQLQLIFDNVESFISTFDKNGKIVSVNRTAQGLSKKDVIGMSIPDFFPDPKLKLEVSQKLPLLINEGKRFDIEHSFIGADGTSLNYHNQYVGVFEEGEFSTGIIITTDVTAKREKERAEMGAMIKGQEIERKRVAADMHDGVGQILSAISIQLSQLKAKNEKADDNDLESLSEKVQHGIVEVRNVSHALKPDVLEHFGLVPAIEEVCNTLSSDMGPSISFNHIDVEKRFPEEVEINVYRIVQELLNNCIKHANARDVFVTLIKDEGMLLLTVEDDGEGMLNKDHTGIGLNNVKLRTDIINGEMNIDSSEGKGSLINIEVPI